MPGRILFLKRLMTCRTFCSHEKSEGIFSKEENMPSDFLP